MKRDYRFIYLFVVAVFVMTSTITAQDYFSNFPVRANPKIVGKKVSSRLMETKHQLYGDRGIHYAEVCTWYGALRFAEMTNDKELTKKLRERFELLFHLEKDLLPPPIHVDQNMFGCLPLKLYRMTKRSGFFLRRQTMKNVNGIRKDTPGRPAFGLMICI